MYCISCGKVLEKKELICSNCGSSQINNVIQEQKKSKTNRIKLKHMILIFFILILIIISIMLLNNRNNDATKKASYYTFSVGNKEFLIGEKVSYYEKKGFSYKDDYYSDNSFIVPDGLLTQSFYKNNEAVMYAAMHCRQEKKCDFSDANVIKINFYESIGKVKFADFITLGTTYEEIVKKIGEPDGKFYMNEKEYVWSFYDKGKMDNPYYVLEFDNSKKVVNMKIGMWWYEGEYEYTVKK